MNKTTRFITAATIPAMVACLALPASAMSLAVGKPTGVSSLLSVVKDGCGKGKYRNQHGHCRLLYQPPERDPGTSSPSGSASPDVGHSIAGGGGLGGGSGGDHGGSR